MSKKKFLVRVHRDGSLSGDIEGILYLQQEINGNPEKGLLLSPSILCG